ncbi:hypothetical protein [Klebsiella pneumoniae IS53]|nr:hypothetical protein [Klebsiella pneumoniae IS53]
MFSNGEAGRGSAAGFTSRFGCSTFFSGLGLGLGLGLGFGLGSGLWITTGASFGGSGTTSGSGSGSGSTTGSTTGCAAGGGSRSAGATIVISIGCVGEGCSIT